MSTEKTASASGATIRGVTHHYVAINGTELHYVSSGKHGSPIVLVHGFPETWWAFHKLIPLLATRHRVFAVDLRGFGDSFTDSNVDGYDSQTSSEDLSQLIQQLDIGPVHLSAQDISGDVAFRLCVSHPDQILSLTAIEMGLAGYGLENLADVTHGGAWYIGVLANPGVPEMLLAGREREVLGAIVPAMCFDQLAIAQEDLDEFARTFSRPNGWKGAAGLYAAMLKEGAEITELANTSGLKCPVLAIGGGGGKFTETTMQTVGSAAGVKSVLLTEVGHYVAMEAPEELAREMLAFIETTERPVTGLMREYEYRHPVSRSF